MVNFDTVLELLTSTPFFLNISCPMLVKNESVAREFCVLNGWASKSFIKDFFCIRFEQICHDICFQLPNTTLNITVSFLMSDNW